MDLQTFKTSLTAPQPPAGLTPYLQALWYDGKEDWHQAHTIAQEIDDKDGAWVHAYLHRKEGDPDNALYWYTRAGHPMPKIPLEKEWEEIVTALLRQSR